MIGCVNGLATNRRQASIWSSGGIVYWRIYAPFSVSDLKPVVICSISRKICTRFTFALFCFSYAGIIWFTWNSYPYYLDFLHRHWSDCSNATEISQAHHSLRGNTSYRQISWSLEAVSLDVIMILLLRNSTGISAALLLSCLLNFRAIRKV